MLVKLVQLPLELLLQLEIEASLQRVSGPLGHSASGSCDPDQLLAIAGYLLFLRMRPCTSRVAELEKIHVSTQSQLSLA